MITVVVVYFANKFSFSVKTDISKTIFRLCSSFNAQVSDFYNKSDWTLYPYIQLENMSTRKALARGSTDHFSLIVFARGRQR